MELRIFGDPAPQGSKSPKGRLPNGRAVMVESSKRVAPWRADVRAAAEAWIDAYDRSGDFFVTLDGPLVAVMVFTLPKPKSAPKRRRTWPDRLPDLSKLARSTEDALTLAGLWADDARVVEYVRLAKVFPGEDPDALRSPGALVRIWTMADWQAACQRGVDERGGCP